MPNTEKYRLVLVEWLDSYGCAAEWVEIEAEIKPSPLMCTSVGWLVYDGEDCIVVAPHIAPKSDNTEEQMCGDMTIPTISIKRIVTLIGES